MSSPSAPASNPTPSSSTALTITKTDLSSSALVHSSLYPHLRKRPAPQPPTVLEEDTYVDAVSEIIERDFFPNLKKLKTQNEFLEAVQKGEQHKASQLGMELRRLATGAVNSGSGGATPSLSDRSGSETPSTFIPQSPSARSTTSTTSHTTQQQSSDVNTNMSLDAFQSKYTSEDNASFSHILKKNNVEKRDRYNWVVDKESNQLKLEAPPTSSSADTKHLITDGSDRPNTVQHWKHNPLNHLMYVPPGEEQTLPTSTTLSSETRGPPKSITHTATGLSTLDPSSQSILQAQHTKDRLRTQEVWRDMAAQTPALFPRSDDSDGPKVAGFGFVAATPSPAPHRDIDPEELMTWGFIEGTPLLVDSGGDHSVGGPRFSMPPTPRREVVGMKLSEKAGKSLRARTGGGSTPRSGNGGFAVPSPRVSSGVGGTTRMGSPLVRSAMLSPAAKKLLSMSKGGIKLPGADPALRASYAGSTSRGRVGSVTPSVSSRLGSVTPVRSGTVGPTPSPLVRSGTDRVVREDTVGPEDTWSERGDETPRMAREGHRPEFTRVGAGSSSRSSGRDQSGEKGSITDDLLQI
ncbi:DiGeorge syndrome critical region protein 14 [Rhizophlyctis rosea]|nr:DiGeorge syndrome critical region protein 14 [Rhizophlyctis rosea]